MEAKRTIYDFKVDDLSGQIFDFQSLKGKKIMIVNTASKCGLTPQYGQLEELYEAYGGSNFEIVAFPSNDFGGQEPLEGEEIRAFCTTHYNVKFPIMKKVHVLGAERAEIYDWLCSASENGVSDFEVKWNFHKFLIDENGHLVCDLDPQTLPIDTRMLNWLDKNIIP